MVASREPLPARLLGVGCTDMIRQKSKGETHQNACRAIRYLYSTMECPCAACICRMYHLLCLRNLFQWVSVCAARHCTVFAVDSVRKAVEPKCRTILHVLPCARAMHLHCTALDSLWINTVLQLKSNRFDIHMFDGLILWFIGMASTKL